MAYIAEDTKGFKEEIDSNAFYFDNGFVVFVQDNLQETTGIQRVFKIKAIRADSLESIEYKEK
jgi:hypothetical protein